MKKENGMLKEQLKQYHDMERELSSAMKELGSTRNFQSLRSASREGGSGDNNDALNPVPSAVEDALLLGTTIAGAPEV